MHQQHVPNLLTLARLVLACVFFLVINQYRYPSGEEAFLWTAMGIYILAALTDIADGYLARRWHVESTFGRIMDPFVDKVLNIGAFIYLAGPRFVDPQAVEAGSFFTMISGVYPWMVAIILARELLVTGIRGEMESQGHCFGAQFSGKLKTLVQSIGIPFLIGIVALDPHTPAWQWTTWLRDIWVYSIVLITLFSGIPYVTSARRSLLQKH